MPGEAALRLSHTPRGDSRAFAQGGSSEPGPSDAAHKARRPRADAPSVRTWRAIGLALAAALGVALLSWLALVQLAGGPRDVSGIDAAETALGGSPPALIAAADLAALRSMEPEGAPESELARVLDALLRAAGLPDLGVERDATRLLLALGREPSASRVAAVFTGRFDTAAIEAGLSGRASLELMSAADGAHGQRLLELVETDTETCAVTRFGVALHPNRVALAAAPALPGLLAALPAPEPEAEPSALSWLLARADSPLVELRLRGPLELEATAQPGARALVAALEHALPGADALALRLRPGGLRGGFATDVEVETKHAEAAAALFARWSTFRAAGAPAWDAYAPGLAAWLHVLDLETDGSSLRGSGARTDVGLAALLALPDEALTFAALDPAPAPVASAGAEGDALDAWPVRMLEEFPLARLPRYRPESPLVEDADAIAGPFGVRVERVSRAAAPDAPLEIALRVIGPPIANLVEPRGSPRFSISAVTGSEQQSLLRDEPCGADRNTTPARLVREPMPERLRATKSVRLRAGAGLDAVTRIEGAIALDLPVRTQAVALETPRAGQVLEVEGVSVELLSVSPHGFTYRVSGAAERLIDVRARNAEARPLATRSSWEMPLLADDAALGVRTYAGALASIEAIFALELQAASWSFALDSARPGTAGPATQVESSSFIQFTSRQYQEQYGALPGRAWPRDQPALAVAAAGPFAVGVTALADDGVLAPRLVVLAPKIPNLTYHATGFELGLRDLRLADGSVLASGDAGVWSAWLQPRHRFGRDHVEASARLAAARAGEATDIAGLDGELVLRLPNDVAELRLPAVEPGASAALDGVAVELSELGRDAFALDFSGPIERFFSARAFDADGRELSVEPTPLPYASGRGPHELRFRVYGRPAALVVQLVRGHQAFRYPFRLELSASLPADAEL